MSQYASRTSVSVAASKAEIEKTAIKYGASQFASGWVSGKFAINFKMNGRFVRISVPLPDKTKWTNTQYEQKERQIYRALLLSVKAKLECVESGIETFEQAFLAHILLPNGSTVSDHMIPQIEGVYKSGKMPALLPGY